MKPHVFFYIIEKQFLYLFLFDRAKIVHESIGLTKDNNRYLYYFRWILWLVIVFGMSLFFYWAAFGAVTGNVADNGECVYRVIYPQVCIAIVVADFFLATGMLLIFLLPLKQQSKSLKALGSNVGDAFKNHIDRVIYRNLVCSVIALVGCFLSLVTLTTLMWIADNDLTPATFYLRFWALFAVSSESLIGVLAVHGMTTGWYPLSIRKFWAERKAGTFSSDRVSSPRHHHEDISPNDHNKHQLNIPEIPYNPVLSNMLDNKS